MRRTLLLLITLPFLSHGQTDDLLEITGDYTSSDSIQIVKAYRIARGAVGEMKEQMDEIWSAEESGMTEKEARERKWREKPEFVTWLGNPDKMGLVRRRINAYHKKFQKKVVLEVIKENKGKCSGWISAWAIPFGKVKIRLCEDYFVYRTYLQEKILVHEMGHEIGILSHRRIHGCRAARRAAASSKTNTAKRSTENYAWLAMSYVGLDCTSR